ncbi:MAG TPA: hypothetical protein VHO84_10450 [Syntrophorhabdaceae bacterium]|nr:hypothetical protein [Syntrophorhabdaceae bacterium]HEX3009160.1 hypothetical protein [Bacteroidales bacterium]
MKSAQVLVYLWLLLVLSWLLPLPLDARKTPNAYSQVTNILAKVKQTNELIDTVHENPNVLKAMALFLQISDRNRVPDAHLVMMFARLFPLGQWPNWIPVFEIEKIKRGLCIVSIGHAFATQPSSLYMFDGSKYYRIDTGVAGLIHILQLRTVDSAVEVTYLKTPGSTRPDITTAVLMKNDIWKVKSIEQDHTTATIQ